MSDLARWRQQLSQEVDSDDDAEPNDFAFNAPVDNDLGLALEEMPLPSRVPQAAVMRPNDASRVGPPPRAGSRRRW